MSVESKEDIVALRKIGKIVAEAIHSMFASMKAGMSTLELEEIGASILESYGARSAPKLCYGYPFATMISVNEEVAHGSPSGRILESGDLVNIDVSAELDGYFADSGYSQPVDDGNEKANRLCQAGKQALAAALSVARHGNRIREVETQVNQVARRWGYSVIQNLVGHGVGRHLHEEPSNIPEWGNRGDRRRFQEGSVLTLEPFLSTGPRYVKDTGKGFTVGTPPGNYTVQYEHTIIITREDPIILTAA